MARIFCTLKEAAAWLQTTEPELKTMLEEGVLPEYRDRGNRLLRVSDVRALAVSRSAQAPTHVPDPMQQVQGRQVARSTRPQEAYEYSVRLPRSGTALLDPPACDPERLTAPQWHEPTATPAATPQRPAPAGPAEQRPRRRDEEESAERQMRGYRDARKRAPIHVWPKLRTEKLASRKGLWMGVVEDRPSAIIALLGMAAALLTALVLGGYALSTLLTY
jgi:hypothetical protein